MVIPAIRSINEEQRLLRKFIDISASSWHLTPNFKRLLPTSLDAFRTIQARIYVIRVPVYTSTILSNLVKNALAPRHLGVAQFRWRAQSSEVENKNCWLYGVTVSRSDPDIPEDQRLLKNIQMNYENVFFVNAPNHPGRRWGDVFRCTKRKQKPHVYVARPSIRIIHVVYRTALRNF